MIEKNAPQLPAHPFYQAHYELWQLMLFAFKGQNAIMDNCADKLLIYPNGLSKEQCTTTDPSVNAEIKASRDRYKQCAKWRPLLRMAVESLLGKIAARLPTIELPPAMEYLRDAATPDKQSLNSLYLKSVVEIILYGRVGLLIDLPEMVNKSPQPKIILVPALNLINWDVNNNLELNFAVIQANKPIRSGLSWIDSYEFTLLILDDDNTYKWQKTINQGELAISLEALKAFEIFGKPIDYIPLTLINNNDLSITPSDTFSPLFQGLIDTLTDLFCLTAKIDYQLLNLCNDTLFITGNIRTQNDDDKPLQLGVGRVVNLNADGDAKYVGIDSQSIPLLMQRYEALENTAYNFAGVLNPNDVSKEASGEALKVRIAELDGIINTITATACNGLSNSLKQIARMLGVNEDTVVVINPSTDLEIKLPIADIVELNNARYMNDMPISKESIHTLLTQNGFTITPYEDELAQLEIEDDHAKPVSTFPTDDVIQDDFK